MLFDKTLPPIKINYQFIDDAPVKLNVDTVYIVGENNYFWLLTFYCPCGCREVISLNLLRKSRPCWRFTIGRGRITIVPSVWRKSGCRSHFIVRRGQIYFIKELDDDELGMY